MKIIFFFLAILFVSCPSFAEERIAQDYNDFGFRLLEKVASPDENLFMSPVSIAVALAMAYNGAAFTTAEGMAKTLRMGARNLDAFNKANAKLIKDLDNLDPLVEWRLANSLWSRAGVYFKADFLSRNREYYGAEVQVLNFTDSKAASTINEWVEKQTKGKIEKIVESLSEDAVLYILNAVYFKGEWKTRFDKEATHEAEFTLASGKTKKIPMMMQSGKYDYYKNDQLEAVRLPYGEGRLGMYVFLPSTSSNLGQFLKKLDIDQWNTWLSSFNKEEGNVALPKFRMEYEVLLKNALSSLGMSQAFDSEANFSNLKPIPPAVFITDVKHKSFIEVNEEGTEAAAATSVEFGIESIPQKFEFCANRPFFFAIVDSQTQSILFFGLVAEPK